MERDDAVKTWETLYLDDLSGDPQVVARKTLSLMDFGEPEEMQEEPESVETQPIEEENRPFTGFQIDRDLGRGGVGLVQAAMQDTLKREIALKTALNRRMQGALVQEAMVTGALNHPNIMPIHELVYGEQGSIAIAMDF